MDAEVARLARQERLLEAAALAEAGGDPRTASALYERACAWGPAAAAALAADDFGRALELAIGAGDESLAWQALGRVPRESLVTLAARLSATGKSAWAARLYETAGQDLAASRCWEQAGEAVRAAELKERSGDPVGAAKVLEAALRRSPHDWTATLELGALLARYGRLDAAVRALQRVPASAPERHRALSLLAPVLGKLGLASAVEEVAAEAATRGWSLQVDRRSAPGARRDGQALLFGRYTVSAEIASSPTARVLDCTDVVRGERVALKIFSGWDARGSGRDAVARFHREVRAMRALDHPHVVPMRDFIAEGPALVLAWMAGGTLESLLAAGTPLSPARAVEIARAVLFALGHAHRLGILHRDVKPANVLFDGAGGARLSDFGVAHLGDVSTTATAGAFGTLAYMSPEQREGRPATTRSDIYAVGVLLHELVTGERHRLRSPPASLPSGAHRGLDGRHDRCIAAMMADDPGDRPPDAFAALDALSALSWPSTVEARLARRSEHPAARPGGGRLELLADGRRVDTWTGRAVEQVQLVDTALARARAFTQANHPGLQTVLRVDREGSAIWLEACERITDRSLLEEERSRLRAALVGLHRAGIAHGRVDREHVGVASGEVVLCFDAAGVPLGTAEQDRSALEELFDESSRFDGRAL